MNYYEARQLKDGSGWHFTGHNESPRQLGETWPVGYCAEHPGHPTREEAEECYGRFLLDNASFDYEGDPGTQHRCEAEGCEKFTSKGAMYDHAPIFLCDEHRNRETLGGMVKRPRQIVSSW